MQDTFSMVQVKDLVPIQGEASKSVSESSSSSINSLVDQKYSFTLRKSDRGLENSKLIQSYKNKAAKEDKMPQLIIKTRQSFKGKETLSAGKVLRQF